MLNIVALIQRLVPAREKEDSIDADTVLCPND